MCDMTSRKISKYEVASDCVSSSTWTAWKKLIEVVFSGAPCRSGRGRQWGRAMAATPHRPTGLDRPKKEAPTWRRSAAWSSHQRRRSPSEQPPFPKEAALYRGRRRIAPERRAGRTPSLRQASDAAKVRRTAAIPSILHLEQKKLVIHPFTCDFFTKWTHP